MITIAELEKLMGTVLNELKRQRFSKATINNYSRIYSSILKYIKENKIPSFSEKVCVQYVYFRTGYVIEGLYGPGNSKLNIAIRPLQVLNDYINTKTLGFSMRPRTGPYRSPVQFEKEYRAFAREIECRQYAAVTIEATKNSIKKFLTFLEGVGVSSSRSISPKHLTTFLSYYKGNRPKYISKIICELRNYLTFLYDQGFIDKDISQSLPRVKIMRNAFIPYCWKREDVKKLLEAVDRGGPTGKRDYALLLLIIRLGLRVSDVKGLKLSNLDWKRKTISITVQKTKQPLELPLLDDVGWAIIDYIKNGRPQTESDHLFVRHMPPYVAFGKNECFWRRLHRYMVKAGLELSSGEIRCGLHTLRSTLARNMLEAKAPLPVISETLGHRSINTTSIYIKVDLEGLMKCALDPEEVFVP